MGSLRRLPGLLTSATVQVIAVALVARAANGYRPFPAVDDWFYLPTALARSDPGLFVRDSLIQDNVLHTPFFPVLVAGLEATVGLEIGFWLLTLLLSILTVAVARGMMGALGARGVLLPLAVALAFCVTVKGLGRAHYDGVFGDGFHMQWLAYVPVLASYYFFMRRRAVATGAWLGVAALMHPGIAALGPVVIVVASLFAGRGAARRLFIAGIAAIATSSPILLGWVGLLGSEATTDPAVTRAAIDAFLFRAPHELTLEGIGSPAAKTLLGLILVTGIGAAITLLDLAKGSPPTAGKPETDAVRAALGLLVGQIALLAAAAFFYGPLWQAEHRYASLLPYLLEFPRSSAIGVMLAAVLIAVAIERRLPTLVGAAPSQRTLILVTAAAAAVIAALNVKWGTLLAAAVIAALAEFLLRRRPSQAAVARTALVVLGVVALAWSARNDQLAARRPAEELAMTHWVRRHTAADALFIVPPGLQSFRYYARRSIYVDFKSFVPGPKPALMAAWHDRLRRVAAPDKLALAEVGWPAIPQWDRSYAQANTPARVAELFDLTGADYLVWDRRALVVPPFTAAMPADDPRVRVVHDDGRFRIYRRAVGGEERHAGG